MKRDWELVREILLAVEALESSMQALRSSEVGGYEPEIAAYHIHMLIEAGLIHGQCFQSTSGPRQCSARELTWAGHEFLDRIRSRSNWSKTVSLIREKGLDLSFETIKTAAGMVVANILS